MDICGIGTVHYLWWDKAADLTVRTIANLLSEVNSWLPSHDDGKPYRPACNCWRCQGLANDPYADVAENNEEEE